jgi:hypothetical protein
MKSKKEILFEINRINNIMEHLCIRGIDPEKHKRLSTRKNALEWVLSKSIKCINYSHWLAFVVGSAAASWVWYIFVLVF